MKIMFKHIMGFVQLNKGFAFALFATIICCIVVITYLFMNYPAWIVLALFGGVLIVIGTIVLIALLTTKQIKLPKLSEFKKPSWLKFPTFNFKRKASVTPEVRSFKRRPKFLRRLSLLRKKWELWNFRTWVTSLWKRNPKPEVIPVVKSKKRGVRLKLRFAIIRRNWKRFNLRAWLRSVFKWNAKPKAVPVLKSKKRISKWKLRLRLLRMKWRRFKMPKFPKLNLLTRLNNARKSIAIAYHLKRIRTREGLLNPEKKYRRKRAARPSLFKQLWVKSSIRKFFAGIGPYLKQAWQNFSIKNMFAKLNKVGESILIWIGGLALAIAVGFVVWGLYSYSKVLGIIVGLVVLGIAIWQLIEYVKEKRAAKNLPLAQPDPQPVVIQQTGKWEAFKQKTSTFFSNIKMPTWHPSMPSVQMPSWKMVLGIVASMIIIGGIIFGSAFVGNNPKICWKFDIWPFGESIEEKLGFDPDKVTKTLPDISIEQARREARIQNGSK